MASSLTCFANTDEELCIWLPNLLVSWNRYVHAYLSLDRDLKMKIALLKIVKALLVLLAQEEVTHSEVICTI